MNKGFAKMFADCLLNEYTQVAMSYQSRLLNFQPRLQVSTHELSEAALDLYWCSDGQLLMLLGKLAVIIVSALLTALATIQVIKNININSCLC